MQYFPTSEIKTVTDYPYGRLKCTAYFSVEFKPGKGFRSVSQTINPKTHRLNNPKKGTYGPIGLVKENEDGHFKFAIWGPLSGSKSINQAAKFMAEHFHLFSEAEIKDIAASFLTGIKADYMGAVIYGGTEKEATMALLSSSTKAATRIFKTGENLFSQISIDVEAMEALKPKDFNPFVTTTYELGAKGLVRVD